MATGSEMAVGSVRSARRRGPLLLTGATLGVAALGLTWAKWVPYVDRAASLATSREWPGRSILTTGAQADPWLRAWEFTMAYSLSVWKALLVALVVAACVDALVPRRWLLRVLGGRTPLGGSMAGGLAALPGMMCTCCTAPLVVTMRRAGVPVSSAVAFWLANPVLNPAVLVFLALLAPWPWLAVRLVVGVVLVVGLSALLGHLAERRLRRRSGSEQAVERMLAEAVPGEPTGPVGRRLLRSFARLVLVLVPEYLLVVFAVGLFSEPLGRVLGQGGAVAVFVAVAVGVILVLPTGGEIPILLGLAAAGAGAGVLGALLITLPALSLPSAVMVGRALGWRVTSAAALGTGFAGLLAAGLLTALA